MARVRNLVPVLIALFGLAGTARADKTLMWLMDQYGNNLDSIASVTRVYVQHYDTTTAAGAAGYYYGKADLVLNASTAYAPPIPVNGTVSNLGKPDSLKVPKELMRSWYVLPKFNAGNFKGGMVNIHIAAKTVKHTYQSGPPARMQKDTANIDGQTGQLNQSSATVPGVIDSCLTAIKGDTVWFVPSPDNQSNYSGKVTCTDHNPFFQLVGTVHVLNPWPGKTVYAQVGNTWYPLYQEAGRQGWVTAALWVDPRTPVDFKIRLANGDPTGSVSVQYMDAGGLGGNANGTPLDFTANPGNGGEVWILPPTSSTKPGIALKEPAVKLTLYIKRPTWSASAVRVLWQGSDSKFTASATKYCNWFVTTFYEGAVPTRILLSNPIGDTIYGSKGKTKFPGSLAAFADWIDISLLASAGGIQSLNTDANTPAFSTGVPANTTLCDTKILAFSGYDYTSGVPASDPQFYTPFGENGPDDNCKNAGGGSTKGLVSTTLNAKGRPTWTGKVACDIGKTPDGPQNWFDSLWKSSTGTVAQASTAGAVPLNAFHCIHVPLKLDAIGQYYTYSNKSFFPFDTATSVPAPFRPANTGDFHFAMHAKAAFEYVPGLTFEFSGDDDLWIFIDKKLALDIGGQHGEIAGTIHLDDLGLQEGKSYQFDMFYTERHTTGSDMSIKTTMNLVPTIDVTFDTTKSSGSNQVIDSWVTETTADASKCPEEGAANVVARRAGNPTYVLVSPDGSELAIDSAYAATALPGIAISQNGSHFEADTSKLQKSGKLTTSGLYQVRVDLGTESRSVSFSIVSRSVNVFGTILDANGDGQPDSVVLHAEGAQKTFTSLVSAVVKWADRAGVTDSVKIPGASIARQPGDSVLSATFVLPFRTDCPPAGCTGSLGSVYTNAGGDTVRNPIVSLLDGIAPVADSAWMIYDTTGTGSDTLYVRTSEPIVKFAGALPIGDSAYVLAGRKAAPRPISGSVVLASGGQLVKIALPPASNPILSGDSIRLGGYSGDALGNAPRAFSKWVPLRADPVAKSWMLDLNGDGMPDSILIGSKGSLAAATSVLVRWRTASGADTSFTVSTPAGIGAGIRVPSGILQDATHCVGCTIEVTLGSDLRRFSLIDSMAPVAVGAKLVFGFDAGSSDTIVVTPSEDLSHNGLSLVSLSRDSAGVVVAPSGTLVQEQPVLKIVVPSGSIGNDIAWARLGTSVSDGRTFVGSSSRWVKLKITPSGRAALFDSDGDGRADSVGVQMRGTLDASTAKLNWKDVQGKAVSQIWPVGLRTGPFGLRPGSSASWFPKGATSCPGSDCQIVFLDARGTELATWPLSDSVAPMAISGTYSFGETLDTLRVRFSETVKVSDKDAVWLEWGNATVSGTIQHTNATLSGDSLVATLLIEPTKGAKPGWDSVRIGCGGNSGNLLDAQGIKAGRTSPWAPLSFGLPPAKVVVADPSGSGRGTDIFVSLVRRVPAAALANVKSVGILWNGETQDVPLSGLTNSDTTWFGPLPKAFALGATNCGSSCGAQFHSDLANRSLEIIDGVPPAIASALFKYGARDVHKDTLVLQLSEAWPGYPQGGNVDPFATVGRLGSPKAVANVLGWSQTAPRTIELYLDTGWEDSLSIGDSARLAFLRTGSRIWDAAQNRVGENSRWVPIEFGLRPVEFSLKQEHAVLANGRGPGSESWEEPPVGTPSVEILVRNTQAPSGSPEWVAVNGNLKTGPGGTVEGGDAPVNEFGKTMGVYLKVNRPVDGALFVYDNMGTFVTQVDLSALKVLWDGSPESKDALREVRISWNATGKNHKFVAGGIYLLRAAVKFNDGNGRQVFRNLIWKYGWQYDKK